MSHLSGGGGPTGNSQTRSALEVCQPSRLMSGELDDSDDMSGNNDPSTETDNSGDGRPSNTTLLCTAFASFMTFATVQLFFAFLAGSSAMKGDSAAMIVDSMTYLFNWYAERRKARFDEENTADATESEREERIMLREKRKLVLRLEIIPPLISVTTLVAVTIVILKQAIEVLVLDTKRSEAEQAKPNIKLMMAFSIVNLGLDFLNVFCFARARRLLGFETKIDAHQVEDYGCADPTSAISSSVSDKNKTGSLYVHMNREQNGNGEASHTLHDEDDGFDGNELQAPDGNGDKANLNMCSAYTHVFADTLRSIAVIVAALVAEISVVTSEEADSAAAIAVSVLILLSLIPLLQGMYYTAIKLWAIHAEEQSELELLEDRVVDTDII